MLPKINQTLVVRIASSAEDEEQRTYRSRVADLLDDHLLIEAPIRSSLRPRWPFQAGDKLFVEYTADDGTNRNFDTRVLGFAEDNVTLAKVEKPSPQQISRVQRRDYLRVPAKLELAIQTNNAHFIAVTVDLSGGGLSFLYDRTEPLTENQGLSCWLLLHNKNRANEHVPFYAEIVRIKQIESKQLVMIKYSKLNEADRQKIVRYCLERQLDIHKN